MKIEAGIFDLGGVVVEYNDSLLRSDIKNELGVDGKKLFEIMHVLASDVNTGETTEEDLLNKLRSELRIEKIPQDLFERSFRDNFQNIQGTVDIIKDLRKSGLMTIALSNTIPSHARVNRDNGVFELFDQDILSFEEGFRKPDPRIYEITIKKSGLKPEQMFFTDEREKNIRVAQDLGIEVILFENPNQLRRDLQKIG